MTVNKNSLLKVVILGDNGVGKSCLMNRFVMNKFSAPFNTIGVEFSDKEISVDDENYTLQIWDTAGQERFKSLRTPFYRGSDICLLCYAVDDRTSFNNLIKWKKEFLHYADIRDPLNFPFIIVATKTDLENWEVSEREVHSWCQVNGNLEFILTSSKEALNVNLAFENAVRFWCKWENASSLDQHGLGRPISLQETQKSSSCC